MCVCGVGGGEGGGGEATYETHTVTCYTVPPIV